MSRSSLLAPLAALLALAPLAAAANPRVQVNHLAPFAATLQGTSVTVRVNGQPALQDFRFGDFTPYIALPQAGEYLLEVLPTGSTTVAISARATLAANTDYTVAAIGDGANQPLELLLLADDNRAPAAGELRLRVVHAAPFANTVDATRVSIRTDDGAVVGGLGNVPFKGASGYLALPAGTYDLKVATPDGTANLIDFAPTALPAGAVLTVFAIGNGATQALGGLAVPVGRLGSERPVDFSTNGLWFNPATPGQGFDFAAVPRENRLVGQWYTFADGSSGAQRWFHVDTACPSPQTVPPTPCGFDGRRADFLVYDVRGGRFNDPAPVTRSVVGQLSVNFATCSAATANFVLPGGAVPQGAFPLSNLVPVPGCTLR